jgi:hypothetical protein
LRIERLVDLGDDLGVDLRCRTIAITGAASLGGTDRSVADGPFVDPLFGLAGLDLLALELGCAFGPAGTAALAYLFGAALGLGARFGSATVLFPTLTDRTAALPARSAGATTGPASGPTASSVTGAGSTAASSGLTVGTPTGSTRPAAAPIIGAAACRATAPRGRA